jgi:hypothetical protein
MSYLDLPRVHLNGTFFKDPSTVNNDPSHYDEDVTRPSPWQNPNGLHRFKFLDVKVTAAIDAGGNFVEHDPLLGVAVSSTNKPSAAKIVDLDVYQQGVSTIFGFTVKISVNNDVHLIGAMDPCPANGLWFQRVLPTRGWQGWDSYGNASFGGDTYACAVFQSFLRISRPTGRRMSAGIVAVAIRYDDRWRRQPASVYPDGARLYQNVPGTTTSTPAAYWRPLGRSNSNEAPHIPGGAGSTRGRSTPVAPSGTGPFLQRPFKFVERAPGVRRLVIDMADAICMQHRVARLFLGELNAFLATARPSAPSRSPRISTKISAGSSNYRLATIMGLGSAA